VPYVTGVLAMGRQIRPEIKAKEMVELLRETAYRANTDTTIIDPPAFIRAVEQYKQKGR
jgi:DNA-binding IclR family transcriptional regulator